MYKIEKIKNKTCTIWQIYFEFIKSKAKVTLTHENEDIDLYLYSETDGFHWFEFFMAQEPNCEKLQFDNETNNDYQLSREKVIKLFHKNGFIFRPQDKETCYINGLSPYTDSQIETIAKLIDERFANRERFFD